MINENAINKLGFFDYKKMDYKKFDNEHLTLTPEEMELLKNAIVSRLDYSDFIKTFNTRRTSYGFKHCFEKILGFYVSNMDFKEAMKQIGIPNNGNMIELNVCYPIRKVKCRKFWEEADRISRARNEVRRIEFENGGVV